MVAEGEDIGLGIRGLLDAPVDEVGDVGGLVHLEVGAGYALEPFACECFDFFDVAIVLGVERIVVELEAIDFAVVAAGLIIGTPALVSLF